MPTMKVEACLRKQRTATRADGDRESRTDEDLLPARDAEDGHASRVMFFKCISCALMYTFLLVHEEHGNGIRQVFG